MSRQLEFDRQIVLIKAMQMFWCYGYERTRLEDLIEVMGISKSSFYNTFGDKYKLFLEALDLYHEGEIGRLLECLAGDKSRSHKQAIRDYFDMQLDFALHNPISRNGCLMINSVSEMAPHDETVAEKVHGTLNYFEDQMCQTLMQAKEAGEIKSTTDCRAVARYLINAIRGFRILWRQYPDEQMLRDVIVVTVSILD